MSQTQHAAKEHMMPIPEAGPEFTMVPSQIFNDQTSIENRHSELMSGPNKTSVQDAVPHKPSFDEDM